MAAITHLLEQSVITDLKLDATLATYPIAKHDESDITDAPVRLAVTAIDRGDFCAGSGIKRVYLEVQIRVNAAASGISEDLLDTLAEKVGDRLQPSTTVAGVIGRETAFSSALLKVFGIQSAEPDPRVDAGLIRQRTIARTFVAAQIDPAITTYEPQTPVGSYNASGMAKVHVTVTTPAPQIHLDVPAGVWKNLRVIFLGRSDHFGSDSRLQVRLNNDAGATRYWVGSYPTPLQTSAINLCSLANTMTGPPNSASAAAVHIPGHTSPFQKIVLGPAASDGPDEYFVAAGAWVGTDAVTRVTLLTTTGNFVAGTSATLIAE